MVSKIIKKIIHKITREIKKFYHIFCPLFVYIGIKLFVELLFSMFICYNLEGKYGNNDFLIKAMEEMENNTMLISFISGIVMIPVFYYMMKKEGTRNKVYKAPYFKSITKSKTIFTILFALSVAIFGNLLTNIMSVMFNIQATQTTIHAGIILQILCVGITLPIVEELVFRVLIYFRYLETHNKSISVIFTSVIFGIIHGNLVQAFYAIILSCALIMIWEISHNILYCIIAHISANLLTVLIPYFFSYISIPTMTAAIIITAISFLIVLIFLRFLWFANSDTIKAFSKKYKKV